MRKSYNFEPHGTRLHEATGSSAVTQCGWQTEPFHKELASTDNRQVGDRNHSRILNSIPQPTSAGTSAKPCYILRRAKALDTGGSKCPSGERSHNQYTQTSVSGEFYSLPSTQERGSDETGDKPQEVE